MQEQREELQVKGTYSEFKEKLDTEIKKSVESFVNIGYLLKIARDTEILYESGYLSMVEFAKGEYNLSKDQVSRFIAINDKYSVNGYSDKLQEKYEGYGVAKLAEMLTLPDAVADIIEPEMTRAEIQEIKREVKEEQAISDIEVILEEKDTKLEDMNMIQKFMYQYFYENRLDFIQMAAVIHGELESTEQEIEKTLQVLAPSGIATKKVRIAGIGKIFLSIKGKDNNLELVNVRANEAESISWTAFLDDITQLYEFSASKSDWEMYYQEPFEQEQEVAPVQQQNETKIEEFETENEETVIKQEESNIIPGQMNVNDYPELQPDTNVDEKVENLQAKTPENTESIKCETDSSEKLENVDKIAEIIEPETPQNIENIKWNIDSKEDFLSMDTADQNKMMTETQNKVLDILQKAQLDITETRIYILAKARLQDAIRELDKLQQWKDWR